MFRSPSILGIAILMAAATTLPVKAESIRLKFAGAESLQLTARDRSASVHDISGTRIDVAPGQTVELPADTVLVPRDRESRPRIRPNRTPHAALAAHWAPILFQDTDDSNEKADWITTIDFDGDWSTMNSWENMDTWQPGEVPSLKSAGAAYWWVIETSTHWFVGYAFFHPRDWEDADSVKSWVIHRGFDPLRSAIGKGTGEHENDLEGAVLTLRKSPDERWGVPELMETQAHNNFWQYSPKGSLVERRDRWRKRETIDGPIRFDDGSPALYCEAKGHGIYGSPKKTDFDGKKGDGVIYRYNRNGRARDGEEDYALIPLRILWKRYEAGGGNDGQLFVQHGGRAAFAGDTRDDNSANPPWSWEDKDYSAAVNGWFFFEPARFVDHRFRSASGQPFSTRIVAESFR